MFNRSAFNLSPYNRPTSFDIFINAKLDGIGELTAKANVEVLARSTMDGEGTFSAIYTREMFFSANMDGFGEIAATILKETFTGAMLDGLGTFEANPRKYHVDEIEFTGQLVPGDQIIIDSKNLTFTKNGLNALHLMEGDFFSLNLGDNLFKYTDTESGRSVLIRITHRDKFV
ncbi:phage tail family protein [Paenibacillus radicis (ex Xue et al. 2023)]|uniref:Phage tail family protein n=1 Tax=Paenibacillus radicis (ex Xue et al. 2023) TaxID=2972489 RepID=A0ABT1YRD1_9BACL|nr:phage tail family protein [Paenibacillus radicis (ex Xue et al. 2023)]MCR8635740.1 phage tail family protein [Paenibacillus radicis (ex Xue et al. 2023)]